MSDNVYQSNLKNELTNFNSRASKHLNVKFNLK